MINMYKKVTKSGAFLICDISEHIILEEDSRVTFKKKIQLIKEIDTFKTHCMGI